MAAAYNPQANGSGQVQSIQQAENPPYTQAQFEAAQAALAAHQAGTEVGTTRVPANAPYTQQQFEAAQAAHIAQVS